MNKLILTCAIASAIGCTSEAAPEEIGRTQSELQRTGGSGGLNASCPGGTTASCVVCGGHGTCISACAGGFVCNDLGDGDCSYGHDCRTTNLAPSIGGAVIR